MGYFGHAWLHISKTTVSTCRGPQGLSTCRMHFIIHFFLEILHLEQPCNLIGWQYFGPYLKNQNFPSWCWNINNNISFHFRLFPRKTNDKIQNIHKTLFWGHFRPFLPNFGKKWIFLEKRALSVFKHSNYLP